jgi:hypothetical protein
MTTEHVNQARQLCAYITGKSAVAGHMNRLYGTSYTSADIAKMLELKATESKRRLPPGMSKLSQEPLTWHKPPVIYKYGCDPFLRALWKYHAKHHKDKASRQWFTDILKRTEILRKSA